MEDWSKLYTTSHMCRKNKYHPLCSLNAPHLCLSPSSSDSKNCRGWGDFILIIQHSCFEQLLGCSTFYPILKCYPACPPHNGRKFQRKPCPFDWPSKEHLLFLQLVVDIGLSFYTQVIRQGEWGCPYSVRDPQLLEPTGANLKGSEEDS